MTANKHPIHINVPIAATVQISTANTNRDGTGTLGTVVTAANDGTRIEKITIKATGTTTAGMVRLFIDNLTNVRLWKEVTIDAITPSGTVEAFSKVIELFGDDALDLPSGYILKAGTHNAEAFNVIAEGGNY